MGTMVDRPPRPAKEDLYQANQCPGGMNLKGPNPLSESTRVDELLRTYEIETRKNEHSNISILVT